MPSKKLRNLLYLPTVAAAAVSVFLFIISFEESESPYIFIFSLPRLLVVGSFCCASGYFFLSVFKRRMVSFNNVLIFNFVLIILGTEIVLRLLVANLPHNVIKLLPVQVRNEKLAEHGMMTNKSINGEGMLYSYTPNLKIKKLPWISVDQFGYRNSVLSPNPDIILLGDSVTIAPNAKRDLAERLRDEGFSSLNLGFDGYSLGHYRDAYKKLVVDRKVPHKLVIINLCLCNDIWDSRSYVLNSKRGLTWKEYLGQAPRVKGIGWLKFSWALTFAFNGAYEIRERLFMSSREEDRIVTLSLTKGQIRVPFSMDNNIPIESPLWEIAEKFLGDIAGHAGRAGAKVILALYPSLPGLYAPWYPDNRHDKAHKRHAKKILAMSKRLEFVFVNYAPSLRKAVLRKDILYSHDNYHPNDAGIEVMMQVLKPYIANIMH